MLTEKQKEFIDKQVMDLENKAMELYNKAMEFGPDSRKAAEELQDLL